MPYQEQLTQQLCPTDILASANIASGNTQNSGGIDMGKFSRVIYLVNVGAMGTSSTFDVKLQSAAKSDFSGTVHNMTSGAITQIPNTGNTVVVTLETTDEAVSNENSGDRYVRLQCVTAVASVNYGVVGLGAEASYKPGGSLNVNTTIVPQQVVVAS